MSRLSDALKGGFSSLTSNPAASAQALIDGYNKGGFGPIAALLPFTAAPTSRVESAPTPSANATASDQVVRRSGWFAENQRLILIVGGVVIVVGMLFVLLRSRRRG